VIFAAPERSTDRKPGCRPPALHQATGHSVRPARFAAWHAMHPDRRSHRPSRRVKDAPCCFHSPPPTCLHLPPSSNSSSHRVFQRARSSQPDAKRLPSLSPVTCSHPIRYQYAARVRRLSGAAAPGAYKVFRHAASQTGDAWFAQHGLRDDTPREIASPDRNESTRVCLAAQFRRIVEIAGPIKSAGRSERE
jgi:hypothetical protein